MVHSEEWVCKHLTEQLKSNIFIVYAVYIANSPALPVSMSSELF